MNAKKSPCPSRNKGKKQRFRSTLKSAGSDSSFFPGEVCLWGDDCCYGHYCPSAAKCHFFKQNRCKFVGGNKELGLPVDRQLTCLQPICTRRLRTKAPPWHKESRTTVDDSLIILRYKYLCASVIVYSFEVSEGDRGSSFWQYYSRGVSAAIAAFVFELPFASVFEVPLCLRFYGMIPRKFGGVDSTVFRSECRQTRSTG